MLYLLFGHPISALPLPILLLVHAVDVLEISVLYLLSALLSTDGCLDHLLPQGTLALFCSQVTDDVHLVLALFHVPVVGGALLQDLLDFGRDWGLF